MSDSSSDSDCFESADEELGDENYSVHDNVKCGEVKNDPDLIDSFSPAGDKENPVSYETKKEASLPENKVQYRKRPERRKNIPVPDVSNVRKISLNDQVFIPPIIKPDALIQDITSNISKNLNIGFNTFHQTSSSIKDLVMSSLPVRTVTGNSTRFSYDGDGDEEEEEIASYLPECKKDSSQDEFDVKSSKLSNTSIKDSLKSEEEELQPCLQFSEDETESVVEGKKLSDNFCEDINPVSENTNDRFMSEETVKKILEDDIRESEDLKCSGEANDFSEEVKEEEDQHGPDLDFDSNIKEKENDKVKGDEMESILEGILKHSEQETVDDNSELKSGETEENQEGADGNNDGWDNFDVEFEDVNVEEGSETNSGQDQAEVKDNSPVSENKDVMLGNPTSNSNEGWDDFDFDEEEELGSVTAQDQKPKPLKQCEVNEISRCDVSSDYLKFGVSETENVYNNNKWPGWDNFGEKQETKQKSGWTLSNWGVNALLNTATSVTQGLSTVLEAGLGAPDPETLAKMEMESVRESTDNRTQEKEALPSARSEEPTGSSIKLFPGFGITNLVAGVTKNIVEHTKVHEIGSKVISGGLDTLESFGKKTMEVLQEGDPGLKKKRALLLGKDKPTLSHVLREAKEKAEMEEQQKGNQCHFETLFDDFKGLAHLEALEMLSRQCELKLEHLRGSLSEKELEDMNDILDEVKELCVIDEDEFKTSYYGMVDFKTSLTKATQPLKNEISVQKIIQIHEDFNAWLKSEKGNLKSSTSLFEKAMSVLAGLTAATVQQFHKGGELLSVKEHRKTVEEADALLQMTGVVCGEIDHIKEKFLKLCTSEVFDIDAGIENKMKEESVNATMYIKDAFNLLVPVLQLGATT